MFHPEKNPKQEKKEPEKEFEDVIKTIKSIETLIMDLRAGKTEEYVGKVAAGEIPSCLVALNEGDLEYINKVLEVLIEAKEKSQES